MRILQVSVLALSINMLVLGPAAHARHKPLSKPAAPTPVKAQTIGDPGGEPPTIDVWQPPDPVLFFFFFQHLANLDAAADSAVAAGKPEASQWKTLEQRAIGLTDTEAAVLKQVAYGCNQSLKDNDAALQALQAGGETTVSAEPPVEKMDIVRAAVDDLHSQLGDEAFQAVGQYLQDHFAGEVEVVANPVPGPLPPVSATPTGGDLDPPVEATASPSVSVLAHISKLSLWEVLAECQTTMDNTTAQSYISALTGCTMQGSLTNNVPCDSSGNCVSVLPAGGPGAVEWTEGIHALRLYQAACNSGSPGFQDPLHYCSTVGVPLPAFSGSGTVYPQGDFVCWPIGPYDNCAIARTDSAPVAFVALDPFDVTIYPGGQQRFTTNIPAHLGFSGPGTMDNTGLYKAPATINSPQTASVTACDANPLYYDDCTTSTIHLQPFSVEVTPNGNEVLPLGELTFTAKIPSSASGQTVTWSLVPQSGDIDPLGSLTPGTDTSTAVYKAPKNDDITVTPKSVTVKACVKPDANSQPVCGTAQVTVPKMQFYITSPKTAVARGETVRLTAFVFGSSQSRKIDWKLDSPAGGSLTPVSEDTLQADLVAPDFGGGIDVKACFKDSKDFCSNSIHILVQSLTIQGITALWNAGTTAQFTITGSGFGTHPTVQFSAGLSVAVTSATDTQIQGVVVIPVALGGNTTKFNVTVTASNGDSETAYWTNSIAIAPATVKISPLTGQLHAGETLQFTPICLTATAAACTSPETVSWQASPGSIDQTGKYTAPASVASNTTATVSACWGGPVCAPSAQVTLLPANVVVVAVSPKTATVQAGHTQPFSAQVTGSSNTAVTWSLSPATPDTGSIAQNGLYTAPAALGSVTTVTVIATSQADATKQDTATVTLTAPPPQPTVTITPSPAAAVYGTTLTWTAHANGGDPATLRYAFFRRRVGNNPWTPDVTVPAWQAGNVYTWAPTPADTGTWEILVWVKDGNTPANANTYGYAGSANAGPVRIVAPLSFVVTPSPASAPYGSPITWTVTASGGDTVTLQYALFRRHAGATAWIPDITAPAWQTSNVLTWIPGAADAGTWEILVEAKDVTTPANNIPSANPGPVVVVAPITVAVSPKAVSLQPNGSQQFTSVVQGTTNTGVTWSISPTGAAAGSIDANGLYLAPSAITTVTSVTVTATSKADNTTKDTAQVSLVVSSAVLNPPALTFAAQDVNTTSAAQAVTLSNSGTGSLAISSIAATGDFSQTNNCGTSLAPGGSCVINVTFSPTGIGTRTGSLLVTDNAPGNPQTASLTGTGRGPTASLSPNSLDFGGQRAGFPTAAQTVTLANTGTGTMSISGISVSADFTQSNNCGASLAAGASCAINVAFSPAATSLGLRTGTLQVTTNAPGSPHTSSLSGRVFGGFHDYNNCDGSTGWAWDSSQPNTPISVYIFEGSSLLGSVVADKYRSDLPGAGIGNGYHAFDWSMPASMRDGVQHTITIRFSPDPNALPIPGSPKTVTCTPPPNLQGYHDTSSCTGLTGWAWDASQPNNPIYVYIFEGTQYRGSILADQYRQDLVNASIGDGRHGFAWPVPSSLADGQPHSLSVLLGGSSTSPALNGSPQTITCAPPSASISWIQPAESSWGPAGTLTAAGFAYNGTGGVQLVWRERSDSGVWGGWTTVGWAPEPNSWNGGWSNTISSGNPTNTCHWFEAYVNYAGVSSPVYQYTGAPGCP